MGRYRRGGERRLTSFRCGFADYIHLLFLTTLRSKATIRYHDHRYSSAAHEFGSLESPAKTFHHCILFIFSTTRGFLRDDIHETVELEIFTIPRAVQLGFLTLSLNKCAINVSLTDILMGHEPVSGKLKVSILDRAVGICYGSHIFLDR